MAVVIGSAPTRTPRRFALTVAALLLSLVARTAEATVSFEDYSLPVNDFPQGITAGDCNDDGTPDLLVADQGSDVVTILRNVGDRTFAFLTSVPITSAPRAAVCADFNEDDLLDIAAVSRSNATLTIFRKKPEGGYTTLSTVPVGLQPNAVAVADFNEDDNLDAVVVNTKSNTLTVLFGNGAGGFPLVNTIGLPSELPVAQAVADFNLDEHLDIAVTGRGEGAPYLLVYLGDGQGTFTLSQGDVPSPPAPRALAAADVDNDGRADLAVLSTDSTVTLYLGRDGGDFEEGDVFTVRPNAAGLSFADFDDDDNEDAALTFSDTNSVQVLFATAPGVFPSAGPAPSSVVVNALGSAAARSSLTDEGLPITDLLSTNAVTRTLDTVGMADPGTLAVAPLLALGSQPQTLLLADMNSDTVPDAIVVALGKKGLELKILPGNGAGGYDVPVPGTATCGDGIVEGVELCDDANQKSGDGCGRTCAPELGRRLYSVAATDVNGDTLQDLVIVSGGGDLLVLIGDGGGRFSAVRKLMRVRAKTPAVVGDFDADGFPDIIVMPRSRAVKGLSLLVNDGTGLFTTALIPLTAKLGTHMLAADLDRNGFTDLAVASVDKNAGITILLNDGTGAMVNVGVVPAPKGISKLAAADFDEDGWLDLLASFGSVKQSALLFRGLTTGAFAGGQPALDGKLAGKATIVDINNDRHQDLVVCTPGDVTSCQPRYGDGLGAFAATPPVTGNYIGRQLRAVAAEDFDDDGFLDFIGVSRGDNRALILFHDALGAINARIELLTGPGSKPRSIAIGDINNDQRPDIVIANEGTNELSFFINLGQRAFQTLGRRPLKFDGNTPSGVALGHLDLDDKLDIVVSFQLSSNVALFRNLGGNPETGFPRVGSFPTGANPQGVALKDLNGDEVLDIITVNRDGVPPVPVATATVTVEPTPEGTPSPSDTNVPTETPTATEDPDAVGDGDPERDAPRLGKLDAPPLAAGRLLCLPCAPQRRNVAAGAGARRPRR